jgi:hypothetical protein
MVLEFRYEPLDVTMSEMSDEESSTYCHSWIISVISKEAENIQRIVAAKGGDIVVIFQSYRRLGQCVLAGVEIATSLRHSPKDAATTLVFS